MADVGAGSQPAAKVLLVGLDGASWTVFEPLVRRGRLPILGGLMARGAWGELESTIPPLTLPAWSSLVTGRNPGGHGVFAFRRFDPQLYDFGTLANASQLRVATLWDWLGRHGRRVGVVNVPPSYPLRPVSGYVVGCMLTPPGEPLAEPPEVAALLDPYTVDLKAPRGLRRDPATFVERSVEYLRALRRMTEERRDAVLRLMAQHPTDVTCVVFYTPDRIQHNFWREIGDELAPGDDGRIRAAVADAYATLDGAVGALVDAAGPDALVVLVSDHGFVPKPRWSVRVNRWLADAGWLHERPLWSLRRKAVRKLLPARWRSRYDTVDFLQVDRVRSRAWAMTIDYGVAGVWIHTQGRFPAGCVAPGSEYEAVRDGIVAGVTRLEGPDGARVFRAVLRREEAYRGAFVEEAPDVLAVCAPAYGVVNESLRRDLRSRELFGPFDEAGFTGTHDPAGIYLFAGPQIAPVGRQDRYPIESIAPTVLYILGHPVPRAMDAPVCTAVLTPAFRDTHPVERTDELEPAGWEQGGWRSLEDEARVAEHLRALGYLE